MEYREWWIVERKNVMFFLDESHFKLHFSEKFSQCKRTVGSDRFAPKFTQKAVKHPLKVMVGGASAGRAGA
jgi:hypothetical protein